MAAAAMGAAAPPGRVMQPTPLSPRPQTARARTTSSHGSVAPASPAPSGAGGSALAHEQSQQAAAGTQLSAPAAQLLLTPRLGVGARLAGQTSADTLVSAALSAGDKTPPPRRRSGSDSLADISASYSFYSEDEARLSESDAERTRPRQLGRDADAGSLRSLGGLSSAPTSTSVSGQLSSAHMTPSTSVSFVETPAPKPSSLTVPAPQHLDAPERPVRERSISATALVVHASGSSERLEELRPSESAVRRSRSATEGWTGTTGDDSWGAHFWVIIDQPGGRSFFANPETGECAWVVPEGTIVLPPSPEGQWWELYDDERRRPYYYQTRSAETRWERPEGFVIPLATIQASALGKRFSRAELGEESIAALAVLSDEAVEQRLRGRGFETTTAPSSTSIAVKRMSRRQPPPPSFSPSPSLASRSTHAQRSVVGGGDGSGFTSRRHPRHKKAFDESFSSGLSTIPSSGNMSGSGNSAKLAARLAADSARRPSDQQEGRTSEQSRIYRRERDPAKRRAATASGDTGAVAARLLEQSAERTAEAEVRRLSTGEHRLLPAVLRQDIMSFEGFARKRFATHRKGPFRMLRVPVQKLARWQRTPITAPLLSLDKAEERVDAVRIFKVILRVCGDRAAPVFWPSVPEPAELGYGTVPKRAPVLSGGSPLPDGSTLAGDKLLWNRAAAISSVSHHGVSEFCGAGVSSTGPGGKRMIRADMSGPSVLEEQRWLLEKGILSSTALRDEIYVQCLKQLTDNPGRDSLVLAWQLLGTLLVCFPPSKEVHAHVEALIQATISTAPAETQGTKSTAATARSDEDDSIIVGVLARHAASRLATICKRGPRGRAPSLDEVEYAMDAAFAPSVFGQSLDVVMGRQKEAYPDAQVPIILRFICEGLLALNAHKRVDLFRLAADPALVTTLRLRLDRGHYSLGGLVAEGEDSEMLSAVLVSALKLFLRELDPPLVPSEAYQTALGAAHNPARVVEHVLGLPSVNIKSLAYLVNWLQGFCAPKVAAATGMTADAIAAAFAPNLLRDPRPDTTLEEAAANSRLEGRYVLTLLRDLPCQALLRGKRDALTPSPMASPAPPSSRGTAAHLTDSPRLQQHGNFARLAKLGSPHLGKFKKGSGEAERQAPSLEGH